MQSSGSSPEAAVTPTLASHAVWAFTGAKAALWVLVLTRITGLLAAFPLLGAEQMPIQLRAAFAALLATLILPVLPVPTAVPSGIPALVGLMASELAIGLLLGTQEGKGGEQTGDAGEDQHPQRRLGAREGPECVAGEGWSHGHLR